MYSMIFFTLDILLTDNTTYDVSKQNLISLGVVCEQTE